MFQTFRHARIQSHPAFPEPLLWAEIEHDIHRPWFYVHVVEFGQELEWQRMIMIGHERSLQSLLQAQTSRWVVQGVQLMTPSHVNGTEHWKLEPLEQVLLYGDVGSEPALVYKVQDGPPYITGDVDLAQSGCSSEVLFDRAMLGSSSHEHTHFGERSRSR
ncbi:hypothetical protein [Aquipseudomonas alcaligenes]|uniref:hypothetical protein n=1 Tax=Aquipseudomonas alcaligenes TaxID=43263 RepID=UPI003651FA86